MREPTARRLNPANITSEVYIVAPTQIEYISQIFADSVADTLNLRTFAQKIRQIAHSIIRRPPPG